MKTGILLNAALCAGILGTGCATKKYVAKTVAPVETRVSATETKNADQDKQLAGQSNQLTELDRDLSRTRERLTDTDQKATAAGAAAKTADQKAESAQKQADGAQKSADAASQSAKTLTADLGRRVDGTNKYKLAKSDVVLFRLNQWSLQDDAKTQLAGFCQSATGIDRYTVEVQGFTDKTGSPEANEILSERRAQEVARYLANGCKIPLRNMTMLGSGYADPVADDKTRDGRKQNRRVEVRLFVPEVTTVAQTASR